MDVISYNIGATANERIERFIKNPDSNSGLVSLPKKIDAGESVTIPDGRVVIHPNLEIDGTLTIEDGGELFVPFGGTLVSSDLIHPVDTIADLRNETGKYKYVYVTGYHTKNDGAFGSHIFRLKGAKTTETDNSGTIIIATIGGVDYVYELQYSGAINVKWFGAKGDGYQTNNTVYGTVNTTPLKNAQLYARDVQGEVFIPSGQYNIDDEIDFYRPTYGESSENTVLLCSNIVSSIVATDFKSRHTDSTLFSYNKPTKSVINWEGLANECDISNLTIAGNQSYVNSQSLFDLNVKSVCGIRNRKMSSTPNYGYFTKFNFDSIRFVNIHTGMDFIGFVGSMTNLSFRGCYVGIFASEFNAVYASTKMDFVKQPYIVYESQSVHLDNIMNQTNGALDSFEMSYSQFDNTKSLTITGMYSEGSLGYSKEHFRFGTINQDTEAKYNQGCSNIELSGLMFINTLSKGYSYILADKVDGISISGHFGGKYGIPLKHTNKTKNITLNTKTNWGSNQSACPNPSNKYRSVGAPINFVPDSTCKYEFGGMTLQPGVNSTMSFITTENNIYPITGGKMCKIILNTAGTTSSSYIRLKKMPFSDYLIANTNLTVYAWVYVVPNDTVWGNVSFKSSSEGSVGESSSIYNFSEGGWSFIQLPIYDIGSGYLDTVNMQIKFSSSSSVGTTVYVDSIYIVEGSSTSQFVKNGVLGDNYFAKDMGTYLRYLVLPTSSTAGQYFRKGDRIKNPSIVAGAMIELECQNDYDNPINTNTPWKPIGIPANIPTTNNGVGTIWSNNGVLTLGS